MYKLILPAAAAAIVLAGCGGSGSSNPSPPGGGVIGNTTTPVLDSNSPTAVNSPPGTETSITLVVNGATETDAVPGGESIPAGSDVLLIPDVLPVDLDSDGSNAIARPTVIKPALATLTPGEIYFRQGANIVDSGLHMAHHRVVGHSGVDYNHYVFAYPSSGSFRNIDLFVAGPLHVGSGTILDITTEADFYFQISVDSILGPGKQSTYPTGGLYALPSDGTSMYESFLRMNLGRLNTTVAVPATLTVKWPGVVKSQTRSTNGGFTTLWDAGNDAQDMIPTAGIDSAVFTMQHP